MADPVGVVSLGIEVTKGILKFYEGYQDFDKDVSHTSQIVLHLQHSLLLVQPYLSDSSARQEVRQQISSCLRSSSECIEKLQLKLRKIQGSPIPITSSGLNSILRAHATKSLYPFRRSTLMKLVEMTADSQARLHIALAALGVYVSFSSLPTLSLI